MAKAIIIKAQFDKEVKGKYGPLFQHVIHYDGKIGQYLSKSKDQTYFVAGKEAEFNEIQQEHAGQTYYKVSQIFDKDKGTRYNSRLQAEQTKYSGFSLSYAKDLVVAGVIPVSEIFNKAEEMASWMVNKDKELQND